jgi:opacity protein-like surface antigen
MKNTLLGFLLAIVLISAASSAVISTMKVIPTKPTSTIVLKEIKINSVNEYLKNGYQIQHLSALGNTGFFIIVLVKY